MLLSVQFTVPVYIVQCTLYSVHTDADCLPCSLTFKGQMLLRIHELLGLQPPSGARAIQVLLSTRLALH